MQVNGFLITHTHWDREWYQSLEAYRFRLIDVFDRLKQIFAANPDYHSFYFDGQTLPIEDYLEARVDDSSTLREWIRTGRLRIGPFYTLLDEQLAGAESFVRNLMLGLRDVEHYGGRPGLGYFPDNFGHISQTPQILKGFGIETAMLQRGVEKEDSTPNEAHWRGADGTRVQLILLNSGYSSFCRADPGNPESFKRAFGSVVELKKRTRFGVLLFMHGVDHALPQPDIAGVIAEVERAFPDLKIQHSDFESFIEAVPWDQVVAEYSGELINARLLDGTFSSRMGQKILNRACEAQLAGYAEPLSTLAWLEGRDYPEGDLRRAWRHLIQSHAHDSITGCHVDRVAEDMRNRMTRSLEISTQLCNQALDGIVGQRQAYQARSALQWITIFNPTPFARTEVIRTEVFEPVTTDLIRKIVVRRGNERYPAHLVDIADACGPRFSDYTIPEYLPHKRLTIEFGPVRLNPFGVENFTYELVTDDDRGDLFHGAMGPETAGTAVGGDGLYKGGARLENAFLAVEVCPDGTVDVVEKASGKHYHQLHRIEAELDSGTLYTFAPLLKRARYFLRPTSMNVAEDFATSASIRVSGRIAAPASIDENMQPSAAIAECTLDVIITVKRDDPVLYFKTVLDNRLKRACLRAVFQSELRNAVNHAHTPFDVVQRKPLSERYVYVDKRQVGADINRYCCQYFTSISDGVSGFAVLNRGLPEYTFHNDGTLTLTLLRASNQLWGTGPRDCPLQDFSAEQGTEPGRHERRYGLLFHSGRLLDSALAEHAFAFNLPVSTRLHGKPATCRSGMRFNSKTLVLSAFKRSEAGDGVILRFFNALDAAQPAVIRFERTLRAATRCRLDETPIGGEILIGEAGRRLELDVKPKEIVTLKLVFG